MITIKFDNDKIFFDPKDNAFHISEKHVKFSHQYTIENPKTGGKSIFNFTHSTGPEFEESTQYVYKNESGTELRVYNNPKMTKNAKEMYFKAKMNQ